ncbi:MAG: phage tail tape measure protein [Pseudomonadota bacterium]
MDDQTTDIVIPVKADIGAFSAAMNDVARQSQRFGATFTGTMARAIRDGKSFEDTLKGLALQLSNMALSTGLKPLQNLIGSAAQSAVSGLTSYFTGAGTGSAIMPFAKGGVVSSPTFFSAGGAPAVMGEAGAEAIMPLARGADGRLGVRSGAATGGANVTFNISTPDVEGFRKSQGQISTLLARTVARGQRGL